MFATRFWHEMVGEPGGSRGVDNVFAQQHGPGIGAEIMGAGKFGPPGWQEDPEWKGWWGPNPPFHTPTFVLTHHTRPPIEMEGGTTFHFLDASPAEALEVAREAAGGQDVRIGGGATMLRDFLAARLIDHMHVVVVPVLLGRGVRLWDGLEDLEQDYRDRGHLLAQRRHAPDVHPQGTRLARTQPLTYTPRMTTVTLDRVAELEREAREALAGAADERALEEWRTRVLGRSGALTAILRTLGGLEPEQRREVGAAANRLKDALEAALETRREELRQAALAAAVSEGALDVTLPGRPRPRGRLHPVTPDAARDPRHLRAHGLRDRRGPRGRARRVQLRAACAFPSDHPARDMWDTFWVDSDELPDQPPLLLRTHTSPDAGALHGDARAADPHRGARPLLPLRGDRRDARVDAAPGGAARRRRGRLDGGPQGDAAGVRAALFGPERRVLMRNSYFPFVEPGVELAVDCFACDGDGSACPVCRGSGWLEIMGAGMVHPEILAAAGYDTERITGFAAGMGVERIAMLKYGIDDIRNFYQNDLRFLRQF